MRRPGPSILIAGLLGGAATASGIALTATSGWLIVRAAERPVILTLLMAIVAVRAFGIARPYFRYVERVRSHDTVLDDLATRRTSTYAALIPLTPARLGRRSRSRVLTGVVDDLTDVVEAQVRVTVPVVSSLVAGILAVCLTAALWPPVGLVLAGLLAVVGLGCLLAYRLESRSQTALLDARAEVQRVSELVARQADDGVARRGGAVLAGDLVGGPAGQLGERARRGGVQNPVDDVLHGLVDVPEEDAPDPVGDRRQPTVKPLAVLDEHRPIDPGRPDRQQREVGEDRQRRTIVRELAL